MILESAADTLAVAEAAIPAAPQVVLRCYQLLRSPDTTGEELAALLRSDPGLTADVLRLANSALYGTRGKMENLEHAVMWLGFKRIEDIVITQSLMQAMNAECVRPLDREVFWERSLVTGYLASRFADALQRGAGERAFLAGLLSDVGVILLNRTVPQRYDELAREFGSMRLERWLAAEREAVPVRHAEIAAMVLDRWHLPRVLVDGVRWHHTSARQIPREIKGRGLAVVIGIAHRITDAVFSVDDPRTAARATRRALGALRLDPRVLASDLALIDRELRGVAEALRVRADRFERVHAMVAALGGPDRPRAGLSARLAVRGAPPEA